MVFRTRTVVSSLALLLVLAGCSAAPTVEEPVPPAEPPVPPMEDIVPPPEAMPEAIDPALQEGATPTDEGVVPPAEVPAEGAPEGGEVPAAE